MMYQRFFKRIFDLCLVVPSLVALSPLFLMTVVLIRIEDGEPAFFRQKRSGRNLEEFQLVKFRSMPVNTDHIPSALAVSIPITRVGRVIRRTNIDELPQLWNILKGEMSVVGPRPALPSQSVLLEMRQANGAITLKPGLTGFAQINSYDGMSETRKAELDGMYAQSIGFRKDLAIILRTFAYLVKRPPVY
jgi:O-antigen biosynthesis protein WbqP